MPPKQVFMMVDMIVIIIDRFINVFSSLSLCFLMIFDFIRKIYSIGIEIKPIMLCSYKVSFILISDMLVFGNMNGNLVGLIVIVLKIYWINPVYIFPNVMDIQDVILKLVN